MNYIHKLDGKTIQAVDIHTGNQIAIATAPFWKKPYRKWYHWLNTIWEYKDKTATYWESQSYIREKELQRAYLTRGIDDNDIQQYWQMKRNILRAEKWLAKLKAAGVQYVVFSSVKSIKEFSATHPDYAYDIYELNDLLYGDEPTYDGYYEGHTERVNQQ